MCANITYINQCMQPRGKHYVANTESRCYIAFWTTRFQLLKQYWHCAKRGNFQRHPTWRKWINILAFKRLYKLLVASVVLVVDTLKRFGVKNRIRKKRGILKPKSIACHRHNIRYLCADCNFYLFNIRHNKSAQMTVKFIYPHSIFKCCPRLENMIITVGKQRIPIAAHPVITHLMQPRLSLGLVADLQSTLF